MKITLLALSIVISWSGFSQTETIKAPNQFPQLIQSTNTAAPKFLKTLPTTNWSDVADTSWYNTTDTSFQISTAAQLVGLSKLVFDGNTFEGKNISLTQDVDLADHLWMPIGYNHTKPFSGKFEGNNKTVKNVFINRPSNGDFLGLFGQFFKASLKNLNVDTAKIYGKDTSGGFIGNISTDSYVENCHKKNVDIFLTS